MQIRALEEFGIPEGIIDIWEREESDTLLPIQEDAVLNHGLFEGSSLLVSAPTTSGKTFIGEMAACQEALNGQKILFLVPLRAVAEEKFEDFETKYSSYGIRVVISTGDHREYDERLQTGDFDLAVIVYEKLLALSVSSPQILETANLIIVDECQMISDESRGSRLEILLTKILNSQSKPRLICLSAVAEESKDFSDWLGTRLLHSDDRPLELREGVVGLSGDFRYREWNSGNNSREVLCESAENEEQLRFRLCVATLSRGEQALIFLCTPNDTIDSVAQLIEQGLDAGRADEAIRELQDLEPTEVTERLADSFNKGVAFHNGDMDLRERLLVERHFRQGKIRILCATSTLAMGVNLPAKNVIVEPLKWSQRGGRLAQVPISVADYRNMGGRAGRYQLNDDYGRSIMLAATQFDRDRYWGNYVTARVERLVSRLGQTESEDICLNLIASGLVNTADSLTNFLLGSFWGFDYQRKGKDPSELADNVQAAIQTLISADLVEEDGGQLIATDLGAVCAAKGLSVTSFTLITSWMKKFTGLSNDNNLELLIAAASTSEVLRARFPMPGPESTFWARELQTRVNAINSTPSLEFTLDIGLPPYEEGRRAKVALALKQWIDGAATRSIEGDFRVRGGVIRNIGGTASWVIDTAAAIASALDLPNEHVMELTNIADRLIYGLPEECIPLARLRVPGVYRGIQMQLKDDGLANLDLIVDKNPSDLPMPRRTAQRLQEAIVNNYGETLKRQMHGQVQRLREKGFDAQLIQSLYDCNGKDLEIRVKDLFDQGLSNFSYERVARQREAEPDGLIHVHKKGKIVVSVTASNKKIAHTKAQEILGASGKISEVVGYMVIGRPDFHEVAIRNAPGIGDNVGNYTLMTVACLAEMWVRLKEGRLTQDHIDELLMSNGGYMTVGALDSYSV